ncbi:MAG: hypothetical protein NTX88_08780 [Candidatus Atribacteria bacterium]|nr:hypothetical protein [Candidatus Atribacteria bacterium]
MDALKLAGLWKTKDRNGNLFLSGRLNTMNKILILPNTGKEKDEDPDYFFYIAPLKPKRADSGPAKRSGGGARDFHRSPSEEKSTKSENEETHAE